MALSNISKHHLNELIKSENNQIISNHNHLSILKGNSSSLAKMTMLIRQLNFIKEEMSNVLEEANLNKILNNIETRFKKYPGNVYNLYKKTDDSMYLSLLSPEEFSTKDFFMGSYRLKQDHTWEMSL